jgi:hypothetical protein
VLANISVITVYFGSGVTLAPSINHWFDQLVRSPYMDMVAADYPPTGGSAGTGGLLTTYTETRSSVLQQTTWSDSQIQVYVASLFNQSRLPSVSNFQALYVSIHLSPGYTIKLASGDTSCINFCSYHSAVSLDAPGSTAWSSQNKRWVAYGVIPDNSPSSGGCATGCGAGIAKTQFQNLCSLSSHELVDAVTNPLGSWVTWITPPLAWYDVTNGVETADPCNGQQTNILFGDGTTGAVQLIWSPSQTKCAALPPTLPATRAPAVVVATTPRPVIIAITTTRVPLPVTTIGVTRLTTIAPAPSSVAPVVVVTTAAPSPQTTVPPSPQTTVAATRPPVATTVPPSPQTTVAATRPPVATTVRTPAPTARPVTQAPVVATTTKRPVIVAPAVDTGAPSNLLQNGDFSGVDSSTGLLLTWQVTGQAFPVSGGAWVGAPIAGPVIQNMASSLQQTFVIPVGVSRITLQGTVQITCPGANTAALDWAAAQLTDSAGRAVATLLPKTCTNTGHSQLVQATVTVTAQRRYTISLSAGDMLGTAFGQSQWTHAVWSNVSVLSG